MWLNSLLDGLNRRSRADRTLRAKRRPVVEPLEDRQMPAALLTISGMSVDEGNAGARNALVTVSLTEPHSNAVSVNYRTVDGTATAGSDYTAVAGTLNFKKNELSKTILVPVLGDRIPELGEYFFVLLDSSRAGARIANGQATVTIADNEPRISIYDVSQWEGDDGTRLFQFSVSLSSGYDLPVHVNYTTADGSATGSDYTTASGQLTFNDAVPQTITVAVSGDLDVELTENFFVHLTTPDSYAAISRGTAVGAIWDDEPQISISDAYNYGDYTPFSFAVSVSNLAPGETVTVDWTTVEGSARDGVDYVGGSGTLTFTFDAPTQYITIDVLNPSAYDMSFSIHLTNASPNASISYEWATGWWYYYDYGWGGGYDYGYYDGYYW